MRPLAAALLLAAAPAPADEVLVGQPAPAFSLKVLNAEVAGAPWFRLDQYAGEEPDDQRSRLVLLSFFGSWCAPCERDFPFLVQLDARYRDQGLRVVTISTDAEAPAIEAARRMAAEAGVRHPVLSDRSNVVARRYLGDQVPLPSVLLISRDGLVRLIERGYRRDARAVLLPEVQAALGPSRQAAPPPTPTRPVAPPGARPASGGTP